MTQWEVFRMDYGAMKMDSMLYGLEILAPAGRQDVAIIHGLQESYEIEQLRPILLELKQKEVRRVVLDFSNMSCPESRKWLPFLEGVFKWAYGFDTGYTGVHVDCESGTNFDKSMKGKIFTSLDDAVRG